MMESELRTEIVELAKKYFDAHKQPAEFVPGETYLPPSGKVLDAEDCAQLMHASLDM